MFGFGRQYDRLKLFTEARVNYNASAALYRLLTAHVNEARTPLGQAVQALADDLAAQANAARQEARDR
jgi:hypothetical protein